MIRISFQNSGGELDFREADTEEQAAEALIEMIREAGSLQDGDKIVITEPDAE